MINDVMHDGKTHQEQKRKNSLGEMQNGWIGIEGKTKARVH